MRLPTLENGGIDIEQVKTMVDDFMDAGFNYFDTAWAYKGSEDAIRQALVERYPRESFYLASKNAAWIGCKTKEEAYEQFETTLKQTGAGYIDFYMMHNVGQSRSKVFDEFEIWGFLKDIQAQGKIKHIGLSAHCGADELEQILNKYPDAEFVQLQINYADWESKLIQSRGIYEVARKHNVPIIIMEPVKGGMLANPPKSVKDVLEACEPDWTPAEWALKFCMGLDGILTVLSGMSNIEQMRENLRTLKGFGKLTGPQSEAIEKAREELSKLSMIQCTTCDYCAKVCPKNIGISGTFTGMNILTTYDDLKAARHQMWLNVDFMGKANADSCIKCGKCEDACPQMIKIVDELQRCWEALKP